MAAPELTFSISGTKVSDDPGFDYKGSLVASFSATPANTQRTFEVYDDYLVHGDGEYRISLFAQGMDGSWNDNHGFIPSGQTETMLMADGLEFLVMR